MAQQLSINSHFQLAMPHSQSPITPKMKIKINKRFVEHLFCVICIQLANNNDNNNNNADCPQYDDTI